MSESKRRKNPDGSYKFFKGNDYRKKQTGYRKFKNQILSYFRSGAEVTKKQKMAHEKERANEEKKQLKLKLKIKKQKAREIKRGEKK